MSHELIVFLVMVGVFMLGCFLAKLPVGVSLLISSIAGAIAGGQGIPIRHLVEGTFSYVDTILVIGTAMMFMKVVEKSGTLDALSSVIVKKFYKHPAILLILIMLVIMFPGMITGSSTAAVLSAGSIMLRYCSSWVWMPFPPRRLSPWADLWEWWPRRSTCRP